MTLVVGGIDRRPDARRRRSLTMSVDNPTLFFVQALRATLIARRHRRARSGGRHRRSCRAAPRDRSHAPSPSHRSPPLSALAVRLMKVSQNQYAETLLKTLGAAGARGFGGGSS